MTAHGAGCRRRGRAAMGALSALAAAIAGTADLHAAGAEVERSRPALAIYRPVPATPLEAGGTGLKPVVLARLSVGPRGKVTEVAVRSIEPSTSFDQHFLRAAVRGLGEWRFRPALRDGAPVATEVTVTLRFEPRSAGRVMGRYSSLGLILSDTRRESHRRRILALPETQRAMLREALSEKAKELLAGPPVTVISERFRLATDAPEPVARALIGNLELAVAAGIDVLKHHVPIQPAAGEIAVYVFTSEASYRSLAGRVDAFEWSSGLYHAAGFLAFHLEWPSSEEATTVLIHEATHAMLDRHIARPGVMLPRWVDEGFATYMELSEIRGGMLVPGAGQRGKDRPPFVPPPDRVLLDELGLEEHHEHEEDGAGPPFTLAELIASSNSAFYGERREQYYLDSWRAVHFLMEGEEGWAEERFPVLILYLAEGYDAERSLRRVYGKEVSALEAAYRRHARDL